MNKRTLVGGLIILVILGFAVYQGTGMGRRWQTVPVPTVVVPKVTVAPTVNPSANMELFTNEKFGYSIMKPTDWEVTPITNDKNFDDRQVFLPNGKNTKGNITEISITVVSKPANGAEIASQADWQKWMDSPTGATDSSGLVKKYGEKMVDGNRSVVLWQDKELPEGYGWSIMTWVRKGTTNYYINSLGSGVFSNLESVAYDFVAGSFKLKAK